VVLADRNDQLVVRNNPDPRQDLMHMEYDPRWCSDGFGGELLYSHGRFNLGRVKTTFHLSDVVFRDGVAPGDLDGELDWELKSHMGALLHSPDTPREVFGHVKAFLKRKCRETDFTDFWQAGGLNFTGVDVLEGWRSLVIFLALPHRWLRERAWSQARMISTVSRSIKLR